MNIPVYLGLSILEISKIEMYEFCYDYIKPYYEGKAQLHYLDTESFIVYKKAEDVYAEIAKDVNIKFDTLNHKAERPLNDTNWIRTHNHLVRKRVSECLFMN